MASKLSAEEVHARRVAAGRKASTKRWASHRALWEKRVREYEQSGLTVPEFCTREGLKTAMLYSWVKRLERPPQRSTSPNESCSGSATDTTGCSRFIELVAESGPPSSGVRLQIGGRIAVELDPGFDRDTLNSALTILLESR